MRQALINIYYSFPSRLVQLHFRNNLLLLACWILLMLLMTGQVGRIFGIRFLFLTPEYLGEVNFWSFFLVGLCYGGFVMTWHITTYLLDGHYFPFLASLKRPFSKFCLNNSVVPFLFATIYLFFTIEAQIQQEYLGALDIALNLLGLSIGFLTLISLGSGYFFLTNHDIIRFLGDESPNLPSAQAATDATIASIKAGEVKWRVDTYLTEKVNIRPVRSVSHYDEDILKKVFRQNHLNALLVQTLSLILLLVLGLLIDQPWARIPTGATIFLFASIFVAILGALGYWFQRWRLLIGILLLLGVEFTTGFEWLNPKNKAYGLSYSTPPSIYNYDYFQSSCVDSLVNADRANTLKILNRWRANYPDSVPPKMVLICVSGGGLRAAAWSMQVLQRTDSILKGQFFDQTRLITGASGGLIGAAYYRELALREKNKKIKNRFLPGYIDTVTQDLLNSISFTIVSNDIFLTWLSFRYDGIKYPKDRGYAFEAQLNENTGHVLDKPLVAYQEPEKLGLIPMLVVSPAIVNDARRLLISPQGISYLTRPPIGVAQPENYESDAIDMRHLFSNQRADSLRFTSALRMNATYPYILPNTFLPSDPPLEVMDAGFRDNHGILSATRFIQVFNDWIKANTSGVVLVQISARDRIETIDPSKHEGVFSNLLHPFRLPFSTMTLQDYEHDASLGFVTDLLGPDFFEVVRFIYRPGPGNDKASMSFHLTKREKLDILESFYRRDNQTSMRRLVELLRPLKPSVMLQSDSNQH